MNLEHFINWMVFAVIPVIIALVFLAIALLRKPTALLTQRPGVIQSVGLAASASDLVARLKERAGSSGLRVVAETPTCVIFAERPSMLSYGFFYPVYLDRQEGGRVGVDVGIQSRLKRDASWNPIRDRKLSGFVEIVRQAMMEPTSGQAAGSRS